jgi:hypothetical protein
MCSHGLGQACLGFLFRFWPLLEVTQLNQLLKIKIYYSSHRTQPLYIFQLSLD